MKEIVVAMETRQALANIVNVLEVSPFISEQEQKLITVEFNLNFKSIDELRDLRNQVVKVCSDVKLVYRKRGAWGKYDRMDNLMSKVTMMIDGRLM